MTSPLPFRWDGESMIPLHPKQADRAFVVGEVYRLIEHHDRSEASHNHYFAAVHEAWSNLPETDAERFPTSEHLRKWALIQTGFRDERSIVAASKAEALRIAAFVRPMDEYAVVLVSEAVVKVLTARSQSMRAMGRKDFQASKQSVLDLLASMIGVDTRALQREAGRAA